MKKLFTKLTTLLIALTLSTSLMAQSYSGGSGTSGSPYQIANKADLKYLSEHTGEWNKYFIQTADITFIDSDFQSGGDFYNSGKGFIPIGGGVYGTTGFDGSYDGDGFSIENLYINRASESRVGFFGRTGETGDLDDINLVNVDITGGIATGSLVGQPYGPINGCMSSGTVSATDYVGGLVGQVNSTCSIADCYSTATVNSSGTLAGGFAACTGSGTIVRCYSTGNVSGTNIIGGFIGEITKNIDQCYSTGNVSGTGAVGGFVGGISSEMFNISINNCYSMGDVTRTSSSNTTFGAFCGENYYEEKKGARSGSTIEDCYSTGGVFQSAGVSWASGDKGFVGGEKSNGTYTYTYNYFDSEASNQTTSGFSSATAKTTADMKTLNTFNSVWDFIGSGGSNDYWSMDGTTNSGYPFLSWESQCWAASSKSTDWFTSSNWHSGTVPATTDDVSISNTSIQPVISGATTAVCNDLVVASGSSLTIEDDGKGTVSGDLTNSGTFTIESTTSGTGSLIVEGTATGNVTAQRYITGANYAWHFLSSPVTEQEISGNFIAGTYDFYMYYEPGNEWVNKKNTTVAPTWNTANGDINFTPAQGYFVAYDDPNTDAKSFTGTLNQGTIGIPITKTDAGNYYGLNLIGNPYPSSIDWKAATGWTRSMLRDDDEGAGVGYTMYIYNQAAGNYGVFISNSSSDVGSNSVTRYIPPMQGFFVAAASVGSYTLEMTEDLCEHYGANNWLKNTDLTNEIARLKVSSANYGADEVIIEFNENSAGGAPKMMSTETTAPSLWLDSNNKLYSILFANQEQKQNTFPLSFKAGADAIYQINIDSEITQTETITLEDKQLGVFYNLSHNPVYEFFSSIDDDASRFVLHFGPTGIEDDICKLNTIRTYASSNTLYILNPNQKRGTVTIYNLTGQKITAFELTGDTKQQQTINTNNVINIVKVQTDSEVISEKVLFR